MGNGSCPFDPLSWFGHEDMRSRMESESFEPNTAFICAYPKSVSVCIIALSCNLAIDDVVYYII